MDFVPPKLEPPFRVVLLGSATQGWYAASDDERSSAILPRFKELVNEWRLMGVRILATLDDDLFMVGEPAMRGFTWCILCDVDSVDVVVAMIQRLRESVGGVRMDEYVRFEARIGRPFFLLEDAEVDRKGS